MFARKLVVGLGAALALAAIPALSFADTNTTQPARAQHVKDGSVKEGRVKEGKAQFPMAADQFKARIEGRISKTRERIVARMTEKKVDAEKQQKVLTKFDEGTKEIMATVDKVTANGTVTKEGAQEVRETTMRVRGHHNHKGHGKEARRDHKDQNKNVTRS